MLNEQVQTRLQGEKDVREQSQAINMKHRVGVVVMLIGYGRQNSRHLSRSVCLSLSLSLSLFSLSLSVSLISLISLFPLSLTQGVRRRPPHRRHPEP